MGGLPRPELSPGPHRDLVGALHDLHHRAGWPSLRTLANAAGCSHTTVSTVFSSPRVPTWGVLELVVEALDGDMAEFRKLWLLATEAQPDAPALPGLAGRRAELNVVLSQLESGSGLLLVAGEAGIGKTRLLSTAARPPTETFVARANCLPLANAVPMLPVTEAFRSLAAAHDGEWMRDALAAVPAYVPAALSRILPQLGPVEPQVDQRDEWALPRLFLAVGTTMQALRDVRPWSLLIEDLHWADSATLDLLEHLVSHSAGIPIVGTWRLDDPDTSELAMDWWTRVRRSPSVHVLELGPLTRDETAVQLELLAGTRVEDIDVDRIHRRSKGLPLFTEQLAAHGDSSTQLPRLLTDLLDHRLTGLSAAGWRVAAVLGAADRALDPVTLENACGLEPEALDAGVRELVDRHLLAPEAEAQLHLRHPLLAEAARRRLLGRERSEVHRGLARALAEAGDSAAEIAEHWRFAGDPVEELHWRIAAALDAAAGFAKRMEWVQWQRAFELWDDKTAREGPAPGLTFAEAALHGIVAASDFGDLSGEDAMAELLRGVAEDPSTPRDLRAAALSRVGELLSWRSGSAQPVLELVSEATRIYRDLPPGNEYVRALEVEANLLFDLGQPQAALDAARLAVEIAERLPDRQRWRRAVASMAWHEGVAGHHAQARVLTAQALGDRDPAADPFQEMSIGIMLTDLLLNQHAPPEEFERTGGPFIETAERWNVTFAASMLRANMALGFLAAGLVHRALDVLGPMPDEVTDDDRYQQAARASLDLAAGRLEAGARRLDLLPPTPLTILEDAAAGARLELWQGQPARACARLDTALNEVSASAASALCGAHLLALARATADLATIERHGRGKRSEAASALRDRRQASVVDPFGDHLTTQARTAFRATWEAELARIAGQETTETWTVAASAWDPMVRPHDAAYCRWRAAQLALKVGQGTLAARLLRRAARDAREHIPLAAAIARTAAYAPARART